MVSTTASNLEADARAFKKLPPGKSGEPCKLKQGSARHMRGTIGYKQSIGVHP
jgi:hypothetical protein